MTVSKPGGVYASPKKRDGRALRARRAAFSSQIVTPLQQFTGRGEACLSGRPDRRKDGGAGREPIEPGHAAWA
jgi:hypothetical protein